MNKLAEALGKTGKVAGKAKPEPLPDVAEPTEPVKPATQPSRRATVPITVHYPMEVRRQLKILASEESRNMDDMVAEALNLLFARYRKPEIAPRKPTKF
jgi:hypothetical protein